jgi:predicted deacetylase
MFITQQRGLFGWNDRSEFARLPASEQEARFRAALGIFTSERIKPTVWVAPNHSFDDVTLEVLHDSGTRIVSDGLGLFPFPGSARDVLDPASDLELQARRLRMWTVCLDAEDCI